MKNTTKHQKIKTLVRNGDTARAIEELIEFSIESRLALIISADYKSIHKKELLGIAHRQEIEVKKNRIIYAILKTADLINQNKGEEEIEQNLREEFPNWIGKRIGANNQCNYYGEFLPDKFFGGKTFGREELINDGIKILLNKNSKKVSIKGIGGIGKTKLVTELIKKIESRFQHIIWISYTGDLKNDFINQLQDHLHIPSDKKSTEATFLSILEKLEKLEGENRIIIIDNVKATKNFKDTFPKLSRNWKYLITSRETVPEIIEEINIEQLSIEASKELFYSICTEKIEEELLENLVVRIGNHPLLIELIAKTIKSSTSPTSKIFRKLNKFELPQLNINTPVEKREILHSENSKFKNDDEDLYIEKYIPAIFELSNLNYYERKLLLYLSYFPPINHELEIISVLTSRDRVYSDSNLQKCLNQLSKKGWVTKIEGNNSYYVHPLIQQTSRFLVVNSWKRKFGFFGKLIPSLRKYYITQIEAINIADVFMREIFEGLNYSFFHDRLVLIPYADELSNHLPLRSKKSIDFLSANVWLYLFLGENPKFLRYVFKMLERSLNIEIEYFIENALIYLAIYFYKQQDFENAHKVILPIFKKYDENLGEIDNHKLIVYRTFGEVLLHNKKYEEAHKIFKKLEKLIPMEYKFLKSIEKGQQPNDIYLQHILNITLCEFKLKKVGFGTGSRFRTVFETLERDFWHGDKYARSIFADYREVLAELFWEERDYEKVANLLEIAVSIKSFHVGEDNPELLTVLKRLNEARLNLNQNDEVLTTKIERLEKIKKLKGLEIDYLSVLSDYPKSKGYLSKLLN